MKNKLRSIMQSNRHDELRRRLMEAYMQSPNAYPEGAQVQQLKAELYRQGYEPTDVVEIALAALLRLERQSNQN
jgi:acyl-homoserine lactone acylase PvdQ